MLKEKAGVIAGTIWNALNETEGMTAKQLKKATKLVDKDLFLGLGWLLREDKVSVEEVEGELVHNHNVINAFFFIPPFTYLCTPKR